MQGWNLYVHGEYVGGESFEHRVWRRIKHYCYNPNCSHYKDYGARGIGVYKKWYHDFEVFLGYVGRCPTDKHTLGRIDNDGHYVPGNVRWETWTQQERNRRNNKLTMIKARKIRRLYRQGYYQYVIARMFGVSQSTISRIISYEIWKEGTE